MRDKIPWRGPRDGNRFAYFKLLVTPVSKSTSSLPIKSVQIRAWKIVGFGWFSILLKKTIL